MLRVICFVAIVFMVLPSYGSNPLIGITSKRLGSDFFVELGFVQNASEESAALDFAKGEITLTVPDTQIKTPNKTLRLKDKFVGSVTLEQIADSAVIKVKLTNPPDLTDMKKNSLVMARANKLLLKISSEPTAGRLPEKVVKSENIEAPKQTEAELTAEEVLAEEIQNSASPKAAVVEEKEAVKSEENTTLFSTSNPESNKPAISSVSPARIGGSFAIVIALMFAAWFAARKVMGHRKIKTRKNMVELLSQFYLGPKRSVAVLRVAGETVLIGVTDQQITLLKSLSLLDEDVPAQTKLKSFGNILAKEVDSGADDREEFSMKGVKEIVSERLKAFKEL